MSRRKNFEDTLAHRTPDNLILDLGGCPLSGMTGDSEQKLLDYLGFGPKQADPKGQIGTTERIDERLLQYLDIDTRSVGEIFTPRDSHYQRLSDSEYIDAWGIRYRFTGLYWDIVDSPLKGATLDQLEAYRFPDPDTIDQEVIDRYAERARDLYENTDYVICAEHPVYGIFELGCWMCGFEDFLTRMALDEEFVRRFFERVLDYQKKVIRRYYGALGQYVHYTSSGDDFATQNAPFVSPDMFRELIKPYLKARIDYTRQFTQAAFLHHSCGSVPLLIDDLIDCGVDILNPIQPKAAGMAPQRIKRDFGGRIVFHGGIDTQELLPFSSAQAVEESVAETISLLNQNGGYIFAAAHNIQPDVNPQNLVAMFKAARKHGKRA